jgi:hypothetical protein
MLVGKPSSPFSSASDMRHNHGCGARRPWPIKTLMHPRVGLSSALYQFFGEFLTHLTTSNDKGGSAARSNDEDKRVWCSPF